MWLTQFLPFIVDSAAQEDVIPVGYQDCMREWTVCLTSSRQHIRSFHVPNFSNVVISNHNCVQVYLLLLILMVWSSVKIYLGLLFGSGCSGGWELFPRVL